MTDAFTPAGLLRRAAAFGVDYLVIAAYLAVVVAIGALARTLAPDAARGLFGGPMPGELTGFLVVTLPVSLYFVLSERGPRSATWGKRRLGLRVMTDAGGPLTLGRSVLRTALKFLPWELAHAVIWRLAFPGSAPPGMAEAGLVLVWLLIGANLVAALVDARCRTVYDRLARTRVVRSQP